MKYFFSILVILFVSLNCSKDANDFSSLNEDELLKKSEEFYQSRDFQKSALCLETFIKKFPQNPKAPSILKNLAAIYSNEMKDINKAVEQYIKIFTDYPQSPECPNAIFTVAFIYNDQKKFDEAKKYYELFLQRFPNHEAATSAQFELANLGKDINDVLNKIAADSIKTVKK